MIDFTHYIADGRFSADAARFGFTTTVSLPDASLPPADILTRLPEEAKESLAAVIALLQAGTFPSLFCFRISEHSWGFDFKANGLDVSDENYEGDLSGDVYSLALDGGGNHHCLFADGRVVIWNHEESNIEDHTDFASIDEALFCLLHREAIGDDLDRYEGELKALFEECAMTRGKGWHFYVEEIVELLEDR